MVKTEIDVAAAVCRVEFSLASDVIRKWWRRRLPPRAATSNLDFEEFPYMGVLLTLHRQGDPARLRKGVAASATYQSRGRFLNSLG